MASFKDAWEITSEWEGKWVDKPETNDEEESAYGAWWGTSYGLTGTYMREYVGWTSDRKAEFRKLSSGAAGVIWRDSRWTWMRGNEIDNQEIANLLFDWGVRRWNSLINGVRAALGQPLALREAHEYARDKKGNIQLDRKNKPIIAKYKGGTLIGNGDAYSTLVLCKTVGNPVNSNSGFMVLTPFAISELNKLAIQPNGAFHKLLKGLRMSKDKPTDQSIKDRYNSFMNERTPTKTQWEKMRDKGVPVNQRLKPFSIEKNSLMVQKQAQLDANTEGSNNYLLYGGIAVGLFVAYKFWKRKPKRKSKKKK